MVSAAIRPPAVAGAFYPGDAQSLADGVCRLLAGAIPEAPAPKALIVPHAGYVYSGGTAAAAYRLLRPIRSLVRRVILLGPAHRVAVRGLAVPAAAYFSTPLGAVPIDRNALAALADLPQVVVSDAAHAPEHSLEVQLPFLQTALADFRLVPFAVGHCSPAAVAQVLDRLWGGTETLVVVSSDLSHYLSYREAEAIDSTTCGRILELSPDIDTQEACGAYPINGLLIAARRHGLRPSLVQRCNSGDTAGDRSRVVGYAAFAFLPDEESMHD